MEILDGFDRQGKEVSLPGEEDEEEEEEEEDEEDEEEEEDEPGLSYLQQELGVSVYRFETNSDSFASDTLIVVCISELAQYLTQSSFVGVWP